MGKGCGSAVGYKLLESREERWRGREGAYGIQRVSITERVRVRMRVMFKVRLSVRFSLGLG